MCLCDCKVKAPMLKAIKKAITKMMAIILHNEHFGDLFTDLL